jgi:hypothetical protein
MIISNEEEIGEVEMNEHIMCLIKLDNAQELCRQNECILSRYTEDYRGFYAEFGNLKELYDEGLSTSNSIVSKLLALKDLTDRLYNELLNAERRTET